MNIHKHVLPLATAVALGMGSSAVFAEKENTAIKDAWLDGKLDTVVLLNEHLNPFEIDIDVTNRVAIISGEVDNETEKEMLSELALSIEGIEEVDNRVQVKGQESSASSKMMNGATDASITAAISTKLLLNTKIDSSDIEVETKNQQVTIDGEVDTGVEKDLVEYIAANTFNVESVKNNLDVVN